MSHFADQLENYTDQLIEKSFKPLKGPLGPVYHYTNDKNANDILETNIFQASFIRSTSDSLEFVRPMAICRNWLCRENKIYKFPEFPIQLFEFFSQEAITPAMRPYFISVSEKENCPKLSERFGRSIIKLETSEGNKFQIPRIFARCRYVDDQSLQNSIYDILSTWAAEFQKLCDLYSIDPIKDSSQWFPHFIKLCHVISLIFKESEFGHEEELRLVFFSPNPRLPHDWHHARDGKDWGKHDPEGVIKREFLPLILDKVGFRVSLL